MKQQVAVPDNFSAESFHGSVVYSDGYTIPYHIDARKPEEFPATPPNRPQEVYGLILAGNEVTLVRDERGDESRYAQCQETLLHFLQGVRHPGQRRLILRNDG